ncbi:MAG: class I SAM-dependent methyltransferase, partial [Anaerolineaceae bacterium]
MIERNPSQTAHSAAMFRAAHQLIDADPKILDDIVILRLLDKSVIDEIRDHPERLNTPRLRALRTHILVRSRFAEDRLALAASQGIDQYVILGAGLDTFAYRQP